MLDMPEELAGLPAVLMLLMPELALAALPPAPAVLLLAAAPALALFASPPLPAAGDDGVWFVGRAGGAEGAVMIAGALVVLALLLSVEPAGLLLGALLLLLLLLALGWGGSVSGAQAGASSNTPHAIRQHTSRIQRSFPRSYATKSSVRKHRIDGLSCC